MIPGSANPLLLSSAEAAPEAIEIERSLRFNSSDSAYLNATLGTATDQDVFTLSVWVKRSALGSTQQLFGVSTNHSFGFTSGDALNLTFGGSSALTTTALFRDPSAWYHIMWVQNGTSHTLYVNGTSVGTATATSNTFNTAVAHQIGAGNTTNFFNGYLAYIHFIDGQAKTPSAFGADDDNGIWQPIEYTGSYGTNGFHLDFADNSTAAALGTDTSPNGNDWTVNNLAVSSNWNQSQTWSDNTVGTFASSLEALAFNGILSTSSTEGRARPSNGTTAGFDFTGLGTISSLRVWVHRGGSGGTVFTINGVDVRSTVDAATNSAFVDFGSTFSSFTAIRFNAVDSTNWYSIAGIEVNGRLLVNPQFLNDTDSFVDVPTNGTETDTGVGGEVRGNYCTLNPLAVGNPASVTLTNGNLSYTCTAASQDTTLGSIGVSSGKWYWETTVDDSGDTNALTTGIIYPTDSITGRLGSTANGYGYQRNGSKRNNNIQSAYGTSWVVGDIIGTALNLDTGEVSFYHNGTSQGVAFSGLSGTFVPAVGDTGTGTAAAATLNFGQRPFAYTAPSGYKALCTANLASTTITTSGSYTGNGVADGPFVYLNGVPTAMTVGGNSVTFGTDADKLSNGFKIRTTSTTYNQNASTYNYTITSTGDPFKTARAQIN